MIKNKSVTSIEWYDNQLKEIDFKLQAALITYEQCRLLMSEVFEQAKEMEKIQIIDAFEIGYENGACVQKGKSIYHGSNYYNETYKK